MKLKWFFPIALILITAILVTLSLTSCTGGDGKWAEISANSVTIMPEPKKAEVTVKVVLGDSVKEVKLEGGTVEDAIIRAGYNTEEYSYDLPLSDKLNDGMEIHLSAVDGSVTTPVQQPTEELITGTPNTIIGDEAEGFRYVNDKGVVDPNYCDGVTVDGTDWNVINGKATQLVDESDKTLFLALKNVAKWTDSSMTREEKLRKCFDSIKTSFLEGVPHDPPYREPDWPIVCANDLFVNGKGDCYSYGAAFAYVGKALGYEETYACNSGGHGWAEIDGKFYDPEWDMHNQKYNHFGVGPDDPCDVDYTRGLAPGADWMRMKV